jgi:hypothetical protein
MIVSGTKIAIETKRNKGKLGFKRSKNKGKMSAGG